MRLSLISAPRQTRGETFAVRFASIWLKRNYSAAQKSLQSAVAVVDSRVVNCASYSFAF